MDNEGKELRVSMPKKDYDDLMRLKEEMLSDTDKDDLLKLRKGLVRKKIFMENEYHWYESIDILTLDSINENAIRENAALKIKIKDLRDEVNRLSERTFFERLFNI